MAMLRTLRGRFDGAPSGSSTVGVAPAAPMGASTSASSMSASVSMVGRGFAAEEDIAKPDYYSQLSVHALVCVCNFSVALSW
jgi:hypothetical protein